MKAQTRRGAMVESGANLVIGFTLAWATNYVMLVWLHKKPTATTLLIAGLLVTIFSVLRSYAMRRLFEWLRLRKAPPAFLYIAEELAAERLRQINDEGYSLDHDDCWIDGEIARGAAAYAMSGAFAGETERHRFLQGWPAGCVHPMSGLELPTAEQLWPWEMIGFRPVNARRDLVKAGAMIIAEIGRHDRAAARRLLP